jgi:DNA/RNA endonuclease G (NUC1)
VSSNISQDPAMIFSGIERDIFRTDPHYPLNAQLDTSFYGQMDRVSNGPDGEVWSKSSNRKGETVWDRGHLARASTTAWGATKSAATAAKNGTFFYTNCAPQNAELNQVC